MGEEGTEIIFDDGESGLHGHFDKITFRDIVLNHLRKISIYASVEFRGGYWEEHITGSTIMRQYIPDTREIYSNSIDALADLLAPHFDEEMKKAEKKLIDEDAEALKKMNDSEKSREEEKYNTEEEKYREEYARSLQLKVNYRDKRAKINRKLFREICCFLYRKKYLELGDIRD